VATKLKTYHLLMELLLHPNFGIQNAIITLGVFLKVILSSPYLWASFHSPLSLSLSEVCKGRKFLLNVGYEILKLSI
jgi:hypothetical protein